MGTRGHGGGAARALIALTAVAGALVLPGQARADRWVDLYEWGVSPPVVEVNAGESVHFTNWSGLPTAIASENGLFDSGALGPGAGYSVRMTVPGTHAYATASLPDVDARILVTLRELEGPPDALVSAHLPDLPFPPLEEGDVDLHPEFGLDVSRTRIVLGFNPETTVAEANDALEQANVRILGAIPELGLVLGNVDDWGDGEFWPLTTGIEQLRGSDAVEFAALDPIVSGDAVPAEANVGPATAGWTWDFPASGANWGLEASRFPQAWNLLETVRRRSNAIGTGIVDSGNEPHQDLPALTLPTLCSGVPLVTRVCTTSGAENNPHGNHVAGTIGAAFDNSAGGTPLRTTGIAGANPAARMYGVTSPLGRTTSASLSNRIQSMNLLIGGAVSGEVENLRVINFSQGWNWGRRSTPLGAPWQWLNWWDGRTSATCGPGSADDGVPGSGWCTPDTDDAWHVERANIGMEARRVAERASNHDIVIVQAAGNSSTSFCLPPVGTPLWTGVAPTAAQPTALLPCTPPATLTTIQTWNAAPFSWASIPANWRSAGPNPIIVAENIDSGLARAGSSNIGGDVSAPGTNIYSTVTGGTYDFMSGTSMATPHVVGLIGYLLAYDPTLTIDDLRTSLTSWSAHDTSGGATSRIDAYASLMALAGSTEAMVDVNDPSRDGNRRQIPLAADAPGPAELDTVSGPGPYLTDPDGFVDMRDFRRFRDAWLLTCRDATDALSRLGCPSEGIALDGGDSHPKKDLNFDRCVYVVSTVANDPNSCVTTETTYGRFDFNGDGWVARTLTSEVPQPLPVEGSVATADADMTDLQVLASAWEPDPDADEGWTPAALDGLLDSGDLHVHAELFFAAGAETVELGFRNADTGAVYPSRTLARDDDEFLHTLPAGDRIEVTGSAVANGEPIQSTQIVPALFPGEDRRHDLCLLDVDLSANRATVLAGSTAPIEVVGTLAGCAGDDVANKAVTFTLEPVNENGATLSAGSALTGADGRARTLFSAGDVVGGYTIRASVIVGDDRTLEDELLLEVVPALKVAYAWRQEILEWSEGGSSRWGPPIDPAMPDCAAAAVPYCFDSFALGLDGLPNALEREGVISGLGNALTLTEEVAAAPNRSRQSWTLSNPDGSNVRSDDQVVQWQVANDQLTRYTDHALPGTVRTRDDEQGIRLFGLRAVGELGYQHTATVVDPPATTAPLEMWFTSGRLLLQPRGDGSALQFAPKTTASILFPRQPDGSFAPYTYCQTIEYDLTSQRGYWSPSTSEWVRGATDQGRKTTYTPGDRPMPVGPGTLRVRYAFGAVAAYGNEDPVAVAPACATTGPPVASFIYGPEAVDEGRLVAFTSTSTDPENDIVAWEWNFGDGTIESGIPNTFGLTGHLFKDDGVFEVSLTVTDSEGHSHTTSQTILVANLPPEATIEDTTGVAGQAVDVPFSVWDPSSEDSQALEVEITLAGHPTPLLSTTREAGFSLFRVNGLGAGTHTFTLRVEDDDGAAATDTAAVTVLPEGEEPPPPPPPPPPTPTCDPGVVLDAEEQAFVGLLNLYRAQNGLLPVTASPTLTTAAERHADDMATNDHFSHTGTDESTPFERAQDAGYPGETVSENLFFGSPRAQDALLSWKSSLTGHNENMLGQDWRAIGIARQFGSGKWFWATSYGDLLDCPGEAEDGTVVEVTLSAAARTSSPEATSSAAAAEEAAAEPLPYDPLAAFTLSSAQPRENAPVTVVNRSRDAAGTPVAATLAYGDGQLLALGPDESGVIRLPPFDQVLALTATDATGRSSEVERFIWVSPLPAPSVQYTGETLGASGKPLPVSVRVRSPYDNSLVPGVEVTFTVSGAAVTATTGTDGVAATTLDLIGVAAGSHQLVITTVGTDDLAPTSGTWFVEVIANEAPVAHAGGPYVIGEGTTLLLDAGLSTDPTPGDTFSLEHAWDLDGDGAFDDASGTTPAELTWEQIRVLVCGGTCALSTAYPIAVRATDRWGDSGDASTTLTITGDFGIVLGAGAITVVPGASNSIAVHVVGSTGWTEPVTLSVTGLPAGVTATFGTNPVTPTATSVLTLTAGASVENGTFPVRVIGTGGGLTRETGEDVTVAFGLIPICFGTYTGTVTDVATGLPVPDVGIRLVGAGGFAQTDENGRYVFRNAALGSNNAPRTHSVRTEHNAYWERSIPAQAVCRGATRVDFAILRKQTGRLTGTVVDRDTRLPIAGARLSGFEGPTVFTDAGGAYGIDLPLYPDNQPKPYVYRAEATGFWPQSLPVTADPTVPRVLDFELLRKCQGTIRGGTVRIRQTGAIVPFAVVRLTLTSGATVSTTTNAEGRYSFDRLVDLGEGNTTIGYSVQAFPPSGSPPGSTAGFATFLLTSCGGEAFTDIEIGVPVENTGVLVGTVRDEETLEPVAGVTVRACNGPCFDALTGSDGTYRFPRLHVGYDSQVARSFTVQGIRGGYYTAFPPTTTVRANETTTLDFVMLRQRFGRLEGTITDVLSGAPIPEAAVQDFFGCAFNSICAISDREGRYLDGAVPLGSRNAPVSRSFQITAEGYWPTSRGGSFTADTTTVVNVQLLKECPAARVVGTVVNAETQAPILGANVSGGGRSVSTDVLGRFTLTGLRAGSGNSPVGISITASASGFFSQTKDITIYCGATIVVDFGSRESGLGTIVGTVTNADSGAPLEDVLVASEFGGAEYTDAAGNYRFEQVPLGDLNTDRAWKVTAFPDGFKPLTKTVVAQANVDVRADFAFTVLGNALPVADGLTVAHDEDRDAIFTLTGSDADADPLTFHVMRYPAHGRIFGTAPALFYRPDPNFNGTDTIEFVVNDGLDNSARATVTFAVQPVNDPPVAFQDNLETGVDVPREIPFAALVANDTDIDGDALTVTSVHAFSGQAELREGHVLFTPPPGYENDAPAPFFVYTVSDPSGDTSSAWVYVRVTRQALAPVCADASFGTEVDEPLGAAVTCTDGNGDALTYELVSGPPTGLLAFAADGTFTFTPAPGFAGSASFGFRASDGTLTSANATATIVVASANEPPVAPDVSVATDEDTPLAIDLPATDPDGDTLVLSHGEPAHGDFDGTTYTPDPDFDGADSFTYTADDGNGGTDTGTVAIEVRPVNDPPVAQDQSVATDEDTPLAIALGSTDVDGGAPVFTLETAPLHGTWDGTTYTPAPNFHGSDSFAFRVSDGAGGSDVGTVTIEVRPANDPPVATDAAVSTDEDAPVAIAFAGSDTDGDPLTFAAAGAPLHGSWDGTAYTSAPNYHGPDSIAFVVSDGRGGSDTGTVAITVRPLNDPPQVSDVAVTTAEGVPIAIALAGTDVDGDPLTITHTPPAHGGYAGGIYSPAAGYSGADSFAYTADDGHGGTDTATVSITVTPTGTDTAPPTCELVEHGTTATGIRFVRLRIADPGFGLAGHTVVHSRNAAVAVAYEPGAKGPVDVLATALDPRKSLALELELRDLAGNVGRCAPLALVVLRDKSQDEDFFRVPHTRNVVSITNGAPGLGSVQLIVNRRRLPELTLAPGELRTVDIAASLKPGTGNTITARVQGMRDATALIALVPGP